MERDRAAEAALRGVIAERARGRRGLGAALARRTGKSRSTTGYWLKGTHPVPPALLPAVAEALGTTVADLEADATGRLRGGGGTLPAGAGPVTAGGEAVAAAGAGRDGGGASGTVPGTPAYRLAPVYPYGSVGDPEAADGADAPEPAGWWPLPEHLVRGERSRVGSRGWGVVLNGDELSRHATAGGGRLRAGWGVFCNPVTAEGPPEAWEGRLVVALSLARELVAGVLERAPDGAPAVGPLPEWVVRTDTRGVPLAREHRTRLRRVYGPAVYYQPPGFEAAAPVDDDAPAEATGPHFLTASGGGGTPQAERRAG